MRSGVHLAVLLFHKDEPFLGEGERDRRDGLGHGEDRDEKEETGDSRPG